ncbi:carbonic anhydrase 2 [Phakopsora pachyrhizi]|uniref:Carbonic anhydrase n=1 Tax=Phakopsora pachyrhizi TaxID=170000 RepID=A0AAV0AF01_PHAPC|nr:carbonic anhydrase 2 [Phakopsora pachyrhizi]KAI8453370.1 carbonic anhydrase 2 [Phakopsora pachyrhizi]CAH7666702.1 carbonic anhydrase 2 [Phakopsora pachyrhizi]
MEEFSSRNTKFATDTPQSVFQATSNGQNPSAYMIGCSDSRVPLTSIFNSGIGEIFESRNIANQFNPNSTESVSALGYAVKVLNVPQVVVVGHEGCGGCAHALEEAMLEAEGNSKPHSNDWTSHLISFTSQIKLLAHSESLDFSEVNKTSNELQLSNLVDVNVRSQVNEIARNQVVQSTWAEGKKLAIHGLVYDINTGKLRSVVTRTGNSS